MTFWDLLYDRNLLAVNDVLTATVTLKNNMLTTAPMVVADLPVPPGFVVQTEDFETLRQNGTIAKYQSTPRSVIVYLRSLDTDQPLTLSYRLTATLPVKAVSPAASVHEYYNEDNRAVSQAGELEVRK